MTQHITTPDATDPRVVDIADTFDVSPTEVLAQASDAAARDGVTVSDELDAGEDVATIMKAFGPGGSDSDGTDLGDDTGDF